MDQPRRGYLTAAYKNTIYAEQAVCLVLSFVAKKDNTPFSIVVDKKVYEYLKQNGYLSLFDQVIQLPDTQLFDFIGKLYSALQTPYEDTLYFDSDCLLVKDSSFVVQHFSTQDFCVSGDNRLDGMYAGISLKEWLHSINLKYIPIFNAGVFRFNTQGKLIVEQALKIMHQHKQYKLPKADGGLNEQVALGIAMAQNNLNPIPFKHDYHFSFFNANSPLELDLEKGLCSFTKESIKRQPYIFHYTPLYHAGFYYSQSRKLLMSEINKLRAQFQLPPTEFFKPTLKDQLALIRKGRLFKDRR